MSYRKVESVEYECDGHCGTKKAVPDHHVSVSTRDLPPGWVEIRLSPEAVKAISGNDVRHFCATCFSLMTLPLWDQNRQFKILSLLSEEELDDWQLEGLFDKLKVADKKKQIEAMKAKADQKIGTGG